MTASADHSTLPVSTVSSSHSPEFARTAMAILAAMVLLIVALTGVLVETTWHHPASEVESLPPDPGSFARR